MADRVKPIVDLLFPCDEIRYDAADGSFTLVRPWHTTLRMPRGVTRDAILDNLWVFASLLDGVGEFHFSIEIRNEGGLRVARSRSVKHLFGIDDRLFAKQFAFCLSEVKFGKPGLFRICLLAGEAELENGFKNVRVLPGVES